MLHIRLLAILISLLCPIPAQAHAAPVEQQSQCGGLVNLPEELRNLALRLNLTQTAIKEQQLNVGGVSIMLRICTPVAEEGTAENMFRLIVQALPLIDRHTDLPFQGSAQREIVILRAEELRDGVDGMLENGVIYLHPDSSDWTVIHEVAHYWSHPRSLSEPWLWEGYADYLTELVVADMSLYQSSGLSEANCQGVALQDWNHRHPAGNCGYRVGARVFRELDRALPPDLLQKTLAQLSDGSRTVDSWRLMMTLELNSRQDLSTVMAPVFPPEQQPNLDYWQKLRNRLFEATNLEAELGLQLPAELKRITASWMVGNFYDNTEFTTVETLLNDWFELAGPASEVDQRCDAVGLNCRFNQSLTPESLQLSLLTLDDYAALQHEAQAARISPPATIRILVESLHPDSWHLLGQALETLRDGVELEKRCEALQAECEQQWRMLWSQGNFAGIPALITDHTVLLERAQQIEGHCGTVSAGCRMIWQAALKDGGVEAGKAEIERLVEFLQASSVMRTNCQSASDGCVKLLQQGLASGSLAQAKEILKEIGWVLSEGTALAATCGAFAATCAAPWQAALQNGDLKHANQHITALRSLPEALRALPERCSKAGWPCEKGWIAAFAHPETRQVQLTEIQDALSQFEELDTLLARPLNPLALLSARLVGYDPYVVRDQARTAFAENELQDAFAYARKVRLVYSLETPLVLYPFVVLAIAIVLAVVLFRRRKPPTPPPSTPPSSGGDLLSELLAQPPKR